MLRQFISPVNAPKPENAARALQALPGFIWFDSARDGAPGNRFSYLAANPVARLVLDEAAYGSQPFAKAETLWQEWRDQVAWDAAPPVPFMGGLAGLFGYDLGRAYEYLPDAPTARTGLPALATGIYLTVLGYDHAKGEAFLSVCAADDADAATQKAAFLHMLDQPAKPLPANPPVKLELMLDRATIEAATARIIRYITDGDIFQANYTAPLQAKAPDFNLFAAYHQLRADNAAPYAGYCSGEGWALASCSPEQFLSLQGRHVTTRPIKGTAPSAEDASVLAGSVKDRAENIMIVDLMRNDLSRVCLADSIDVPALCAVEEFAGLRHLVSTVTGTLAPDRSAFDLLAACFPGGSITGAPKIRAMQIIDELETMQRGAYCGALAYVSWAGDMDSSILIRTLAQRGDTLTLQAGGGIVAASDPVAECDELLLKAHRIVDVLAAATKKQAEAA